MPDPDQNEIVDIKYKPDIKERAEDDVLKAFLEGEEFLVLEIQVVGTVDDAKDKDPLTIAYLVVCNTKVITTPWMQDKMNKLTIICKKTVMNLKPQRIAGLIPLIKKHDQHEICLYRLSAWMFMDENGTKKWNIKDKIDPALIEVDALAPKKAEDAREWAKAVFVDFPMKLD